MGKVGMIFSTMLFSITLAGCGDVTVNPPARPVVVREKPVIVEKTVVEKPVIIEKTVVEKPVVEKKTIIIDKR